MRNQIVILAAGQGKRMGVDMPKVMVSLAGKPVILHLLEELDKITQLIKPVVVVGYMKEKLMEFLGDNYTYAVQQHQLGTAHAVIAAKNKIKANNILVLYGDMPFIRAQSLRQLMRLHRDKEAKLSMFTATVPNFENQFSGMHHFGRVIRDYKNKIIKITEYKDASESEKKIKEINPGIYMFETKWLWDNLKQIKNKNFQHEYYLTDIVEVAIKEQVKIYDLAIDPKEVLGINSKEDVLLAESLLEVK